MLKKGIFVGLIAIFVLWALKEEHTFPKDGALGKRVLITGASSGIGENLAYEYAKHGASVFITARRKNRLIEVIKKCKELGRPGAKFGYYAADMYDYVKETKLFVDAGVKHLGGIDTIVVNHAWVPEKALFWIGTEYDMKHVQFFEKQMAINFNSYVHVASHALPFLKKQKDGKIGIVGSVAGKIPVFGASLYAGAKFALDGFFSSLRLELQQSNSGVSVTYGVIGGTDTDMLQMGLEKLQSFNDSQLDQMLASTANDLDRPETVAYEMMVATENRAYELYPRRFYRLFPIVRSIFPTINLFELDQDIYRKYEEKMKIRETGK